MQRLWAPWRMSYISEIDVPKQEGCFFCNAWNDVGNEAKHLVLGRGNDAFIMLNRFPYANGHLMIVPAAHAGSVEDISPDTGRELWRLTTVAKLALERAVHCQGANIGINQGRIAGAGVASHLHIHIVPRWDGDVNFMPVMADIKIIPQALEETRDHLEPFVRQLLEVIAS